ncbi:acrosomal protein KIAA1210 homolog isoform 2-T2 [Vipera latastei]
MTTSEEEPEVLEGEEFAGKKRSKFQTFKNFFAKKKKSKDLLTPTEEAKLQPSQANSDGGSPQLDSILLHSPAETESNGGMGDQALMHDSECLSQALCDVVGEISLQENFPGKVKKIEQSLCIESPLVITTGKRMDGVGIISEDGILPRGLLEISTVHDVLISSTTQASCPLQLCSNLSLDETDGEDSQAALGSPPKHRSNSLPLESPASPHGQALPVDFNTPASPLGCLDTSAARHRIAMNPRKQKGVVKKSRHFPQVESMLEEQEPLEPEGDERRPSKLLEEAAGQGEAWEGMLSHHVVKGNEDGTDNASSGTGASEALPSSHSTGLQGDEMCALISDAQNVPETQLQLSSTVPCPNVPASFIKGREIEKMDHEEKKETCLPTDDPKAQSGPEVTENSKSFPFKTKATGFHSTPPSALPKGKVGKEPVAEDIQIACSQRTDVRANVSKPARNRHRACERSVCGDSSTSLEADPMLHVPQLFSSALKASSDAPKDFMHKNRHAVNEDGRGPSDMELQPSQGPGKPIDSLQGTLSAPEVDPDRPVLRNAAGKKPCLLPEDSTVRELGSLSSGRPSTVGSTEVASKTCPPLSTPGVQLGNVITKEESKATQMSKIQTKSSAKPVRFTIAPAWQRSLSGGSSSVNNSCPQTSPTSPVRPESFEGTSPLDAGFQLISTPERPDRANRNTGVHLNSSPEEVQNSQSPFGVKLRRTSSLLKYQTEHHWDPHKLAPLAVSSPSSIKIEAKVPSSGTSLQNRTDGTKDLLADSGKQGKNLLWTKPGEGGTKLQASKPSEQIPTVFLASPSVQPAWISMAKQKQQGFQEDAVAKGQKEREEVIAKMEKAGPKPTSTSHLQKQVSLSGDGSPKKSIPYQNVCLLENKVGLKSAPVAAKGFARILTQEGPQLEKDTRLPPILPVASCSSTKPPWLSLAKKKAKAWSEMPQAVQ